MTWVLWKSPTTRSSELHKKGGVFTQHIISIAVDFDDDRVRKIIEDRVENELETVVNKLVLDQFAPVKQHCYGASGGRDFGHIKSLMSASIDTFLDSRSDEITELAAKMLVSRIGKSKVWKDKIGDILKEVL